MGPLIISIVTLSETVLWTRKKMIYLHVDVEQSISLP